MVRHIIFSQKQVKIKNLLFVNTKTQDFPHRFVSKKFSHQWVNIPFGGTKIANNHNREWSGEAVVKYALMVIKEPYKSCTHNANDVGPIFLGLPASILNKSFNKHTTDWLLKKS